MRALLVVVLSATVAHADDLAARVHELKLANGMTWLVVERHEAPVFTGFVRVRAGGLDEVPGQTGLAHLFEHMAFKGTPALGTTNWEAERPLLDEIARVGDALAALERRGDGASTQAQDLKARLAELAKQHKALTDENALARLYQTNGGVGLNATTDKDVTSYFVSMPKNRLELWLTVEAQRLASPVLRDFFTERDVVQEERLRSIESNPGGALYEELNHLAFVSSPYRWPTLGYTPDLKAMTIASAHEFHRTHYAPSNTVGCLVGDVTMAEARPLLEKTFGLIPDCPVAPQPVFSEPPARAQRRSVVTFDASPRLMLAFRTPPPPSHDADVLEVVQTILSEGNTSRLQHRLVYGDRSVQGIGAFAAPGVRLQNLFVISATPMKGVTTETVERGIWEELKKLQADGPTELELTKAKNKLSANFARGVESNSGLANALSRFQTILGSWKYALDYPKTIEAVTATEVRDVAKKYFVPEQSIVVTLQAPGVKP